MRDFIFVQLSGIIPLVLFVFSIRQKKKEDFLLLHSFCPLFFAIQYIIAKKATGAANSLIAFIREVVFYYCKKK